MFALGLCLVILSRVRKSQRPSYIRRLACLLLAIVLLEDSDGFLGSTCRQLLIIVASTTIRCHHIQLDHSLILIELGMALLVPSLYTILVLSRRWSGDLYTRMLGVFQCISIHTYILGLIGEAYLLR